MSPTFVGRSTASRLRTIWTWNHWKTTKTVSRPVFFGELGSYFLIDDEHARELEERWIDSLDGGASAASRSSPVPTTILQGILVGFFFPLLPFFFFREPRAAVFWENGRPHDNASSVIFSRVFLLFFHRFGINANAQEAHATGSGFGTISQLCIWDMEIHPRQMKHFAYITDSNDRDVCFTE